MFLLGLTKDLHVTAHFPAQTKNPALVSKTQTQQRHIFYFSVQLLVFVLLFEQGLRTDYTSRYFSSFTAAVDMTDSLTLQSMCN